MSRCPGFERLTLTGAHVKFNATPFFWSPSCFEVHHHRHYAAEIKEIELNVSGGHYPSLWFSLFTFYLKNCWWKRALESTLGIFVCASIYVRTYIAIFFFKTFMYFYLSAHLL